MLAQTVAASTFADTANAPFTDITNSMSSSAAFTDITNSIRSAMPRRPMPPAAPRTAGPPRPRRHTPNTQNKNNLYASPMPSRSASMARIVVLREGTQLPCRPSFSPNRSTPQPSFRSRKLQGAHTARPALLAEAPRPAASLARSRSASAISFAQRSGLPTALSPTFMQRARSAPTLRLPSNAPPAQSSSLGASLRYSSCTMLLGAAKPILSSVPAARYFFDPDTGRSLALRC